MVHVLTFYGQNEVLNADKTIRTACVIFTMCLINEKSRNILENLHYQLDKRFPNSASKTHTQLIEFTKPTFRMVNHCRELKTPKT